MQSELVRRLAVPVPRYTSYPTAPNFSGAVGASDYRDWLCRLPEESRLSLYLHIPFCRELCWYCACNTRAARRYAPVESYVGSLLAETEAVAGCLPGGMQATHIHWGGGSPSMLRPDEIRRIASMLAERFAIAPDADHSVEIDPRALGSETMDAFAQAGINRVSIGVQDFDPAVQAGINRMQSFEETRRAVEGFRERGVRSVNIDLVYGLARQTRASVERTIEGVLSLEPDRLAVFGYAHVPAKAKHQRLIEAARLPGADERIEQLAAIGGRLLSAGYVQIGIDHFALPSDSLARGPVRRNFQGYTTDDSDAIIGLGASSIGQLPEGYVQNAVPVGDYARRVAASGLATVRGIRLSTDDRMRAHVIERLMCDFSFSRTELVRRFGSAAFPLIREADTIAAADADGLVERTSDGFRLTDAGRTFVRSLCARFDAYWGKTAATHALAV